MAETITWSQQWFSNGNVLTTGLNSLGDGSRSNAGAAFNNGSALARYAKLVLSLTFSVAPTSGGAVWIYLISAVDGTNYEAGSSSVDPGPHNIIAFVPVQAVTTLQLLTSPVFAIPPSPIAFLMTNKAGTGSSALSSSGNTVTLYTSNDYLTP